MGMVPGKNCNKFELMTQSVICTRCCVIFYAVEPLHNGDKVRGRVMTSQVGVRLVQEF